MEILRSSQNSGPSPSKLVNLVKSSQSQKHFDITKCIICQSRTNSEEALYTGQDGRTKIIYAASIRKDETHERLMKLSNCKENLISVEFKYHMNNQCYKAYTHKEQLRKLEKKRALEPTQEAQKGISEPSSGESPNKILRKDTQRLSTSSSDINSLYLKCLICRNENFKNKREKFHLCEAETICKIVKTALSKRDHVYPALADRLKDEEEDTVKSIAAGNFFCHAACKRNYLRSKKEQEVATERRSSLVKNELIQRTVPFVDKIIENGDCCTMSDLTAYANSLIQEGEIQSNLQNRDLKKFLEEHYADKITISSNERVNESDIFYSSKITAADLLIKIKNQNLFREAGLQMAKDFDNVDFGLQDTFCDAADLLDSWKKTKTPDSWITFCSALCSHPKHKLFQSKARDFSDMMNDMTHEEGDIEDDESLNERGSDETSSPRDMMSIRIHCLFQMMYYLKTGGKKKFQCT